MQLLTPDEIDRLIVCEKKITEAPKKEAYLINRHYRNGFKAQSTDDQHDFTIAIRQSDELPDNFSVVLNYTNAEGTKFLLYRCNGPHGESVTDIYDAEPHVGYHEHTLIRGLKGMKSEGSDNFGSFHDAIAYFMRNCHILGAETYFTFLNGESGEQLELEL